MLRILLLTLLALLPQQAAAHAQLQSADPAAGALMAVAPAQVTLTFNEPVALLQARWFAPDGTATEAEARSENTALIIAPPPGLSPGTHALSWRVVSTDGHPVGGTHVFSIGFESGAPDTATAPVPWPAAIARGLVTLALAFGVGGVLWSALARRAGRRARILALAALPAAALMLAAQAMDMAGQGTAALASPAAWSVALHSPYGLAALLAALAGLIAFGARDLRVMAFAAWGLAALSFAVAGHAARAEPVALMGALVFAHAAALIFWAGALPGLIMALRGPDAAAQMARFSRLALPMVALLVVSGSLLAWRQLETPAALTGTAYGTVLLAKLVLVAVVLALAARHRLVLTPALARNPARARPAFHRSLRLELWLMVAILALTAAFRLTPPPRALGTLPETRAEVHLHGIDAMADITLIPGRPGPNRAEIVPLDGDFQPFTPLEITLFLSRPAEGLEPIELRAEPGEDGIWHAAPFHLPQGGAWDVVADILISDFRKALIGGEIRLLP
ncbi:copper resistance CopC/CopD family protein [Pararhodobacter sp.]|uniref:copper resistance CopC/CopD family protein n=1 Tax=Pararhodobacter sp. TaxID=2127056 RepID=UPI002FDD1522